MRARLRKGEPWHVWAQVGPDQWLRSSAFKKLTLELGLGIPSSLPAAWLSKKANGKVVWSKGKARYTLVTYSQAALQVKA